MYQEHLPTALWAYASVVSSFPHDGFVGFGAFFFHYSPREENSNKLLGDSRQENQKEMNYLRKCVKKLAQGGCASAQALPEPGQPLIAPRPPSAPGAPQKQRLGVSIHVDGGCQSTGLQV